MSRSIRYTDIADVRRHYKWGYQVVINHGVTEGDKISEGRMLAQAKWVKQRLIEQGDDNVRDLYIFHSSQKGHQTQVTLAGAEFQLAL